MPLDFDNQYYKKGYNHIVGLDEAGRGCLLGPVVAAAVVLPSDFYHPLINDSKKLTEKQREEAFKIIKEHAISYAIGMREPEEIDKMNILEASRASMMDALNQIDEKDYDLIITDFMKLPKAKKEVIDIPHGDATSLSVAAASIIAKVTRDHICIELEKKYPNFKISTHKGYGTKLHLDELAQFGPIKGLHRFSYKPVKNCLIEKVQLF